MFNNKRFWLTILISVFLLHINSFAQIIGYASLDGAMDSNPFRSPQAQSSWISEVGFGIQPKFDDIFISYTGNYTSFDAFPERNFFWHQVALFTEIKNFEFGGLFQQSINSTDYEILNSNQIIGYVNSNFSALDFNIYTNLEGTFNNYSLLKELNNFNLDAGIKMQRSFETGTTLILGSIFHYKKYLNNILVEDSLGQTTNTTHMGQGPGSGGQSAGLVYSEYEAPSVSQFELWGRLAQSITKTTGLAAQYQSRIIVGGTSRYLSFTSFNYADESQIFDDPLGYESQSYGMELTQLLPWGIIMKGAFYKNSKDYTTQGIYTDMDNYDFNVLRKDTRTNAWLTLQKKIAGNFLGSKNVSIKLTHQWMDNESNSYWYNYQSSYTGLGFSLNF